ncbi:MAG: hypothetical protein WBQ17_00270 [Rhizomicrobium sp.]
MGGKIRAGAMALTAGLTVAAMATTATAAPKCAKPIEVSAIQTAAIQQELMVAALTCNEIDHFNAFQVGFSKELRASDATLEHMFKRLFGGGRGEAQYHAFKTRLANDSSMRSIHDNVDYCQQARQVFAAALVANKPTLADFAASVPVIDESPVNSCEIRVAGGLSSMAARREGVIVPTPNPLRMAMVDRPLAPVSAVTMPPAQPQPVAATNVPAAEKPAPKKESGGLLSGIFGN